MNDLLGLDESAISPLVRAITSTDLPTESVAAYFARASWTGIAEPGDGAAGQLVSALGPVDSLRAVVEEWPVPRLAEVARAGGSDLSADDLAAAIARWKPRLLSATAITALQQADRFSVRLLTPEDQAWPARVDDLGPHAPIALWVRGNLSTLVATASSVALVGARAATGYGEHITMEASAGLVDRGYAIISGAAYGIDGMAHRAALASSGQTVAYLAGGVDRFYPSGHDALLSRIVEKGAVVSELPCGSSPTKWRFLQRNRLIAATSQATIVLEAGWRSGSLNTAAHAATIGRPVGAVPGPVTSAASAGCHRLIREFTATLVTTAAEMAALLTSPQGESDAEQQTARSTTAIRVIDAMSYRDGRSVENIAARCGLSVVEVQVQLGALDLEGSVTENGRGWTTRRR